ncbi:MAG TPA: NYN domain-containing protein, partial [Actinomycetales bacterium]
DGGGADDAAAVDAGVTGLPAGHDPVDVAVAAYLLRPDGWPALVHAAHDAEHERHAAAAADEVRALADRLGADLAAARAELQAVRSEAAQAQQQAADELAGVRRELRRHRSDADRARAEGRAALAEAADLQAEATAAAETADERVRRADREVAEAVEALQGLRRAGREGRSLAGSRARLLLDTLVDAATGLRHELALPPADVLPADVVAGSLAEPVEEQPGTPARARAQDDPAILDELLSLPRAHLVVDGYNVTKSAYGTLPLVDQRRRLLVGLSALAARTRVEVTCVFDGTTIEGRVAAPSARGVRVMFSEAGEIADELIRRLVRAEPPGRVVVVVSSDREVADGVRASGARPVPSASLARLLDRG